ncbi:phosphatidylserine synthase [Bacteroidia bacterium]|nr:phosphatidylserine synthase [Bacteroidia bacterium]
MKLFTIPNLLTLGNVLMGCLSVAFASSGNLGAAFVCILAAAVFDFADGFAARLLNSYSAIGKQLDSLADMLSFGFAPAFMLFVATGINDDIQFSMVYLPTCDNTVLNIVLLYCPFLLTAFSALRLAKFDVDERQTTSFIGLPTPANALFFGSLALLNAQQMLPFVLNGWCVLGLVVVFSYLLVSEIPMFSLKIKNFSLQKYAVQIAFIAVAAVLCIVWRVQSIPLIILLYIVLSIIVDITHLKKNTL